MYEEGLTGCDWRQTLPSGNATFRSKLSDSDFEEENGNPRDNEENEVGNEKRSTSISIAQVRKTPNVTKANEATCHG